MSTGILEQILARLTAIEAQLAALAEQVRAPALPGSGDDNVWSDGSLTIAEAVAFSGLKRTKLYDLMNAGDLVWSDPGGRRLIPRKALARLLVGHARTAEGSLT